jgi:hypothetical protein
MANKAYAVNNTGPANVVSANVRAGLETDEARSLSQINSGRMDLPQSRSGL